MARTPLEVPAIFRLGCTQTEGSRSRCLRASPSYQRNQRRRDRSLGPSRWGQTQTPATKVCRANNRSRLRSNRPAPPSLHTTGMRQLLQKRRICLNLISSRWLRHSTGYALAARRMNTRRLQHFLGTASITNTVRYPPCPPSRLRTNEGLVSYWSAVRCRDSRECPGVSAGHITRRGVERRPGAGPNLSARPRDGASRRPPLLSLCP